MAREDNPNWGKGRWKKGQSGNPLGRPKHSLAKDFSKIPRGARDEIYRVLYHSLTLSSTQEAIDYIKKEKEESGKYGFIYQICLKTLLGPNGWNAMLEICDRIFGKPKQQNDITVHSESETPLITIGGKEDE